MKRARLEKPVLVSALLNLIPHHPHLPFPDPRPRGSFIGAMMISCEVWRAG